MIDLDDKEALWNVLDERRAKRSTHQTPPVSLLDGEGKEEMMEAAAKITSKGQVTVPRIVRDALGIQAGDAVVFRVEGNRAVLARTPEFLALAGTVEVPARKRNVVWDDVIRRTRAARARDRL